MSVETLPLETARRLFLHRHGLCEPPVGPGRGAALNDLVDRLGFVQVDSVNTLARAHDLILWSRRGQYRPENLRWLNDRKRATFEHWTHDAAIIPMRFYPYWRHKFARDKVRMQTKWVAWHGPAFQDELASVTAHIRSFGAVTTANLSGKHAEKSTGWWDWHPSKTALEFLWRSGVLAVSRRDGFRKVYDLAERVVPSDYVGAEVSEAETVDWACAAALDRLGFATSGELAAFWDLVTPQEARAWVENALRSGRVVPVDIGSADGSARRSIAWPGISAAHDELPEPPRRLRILSPFDPSLRDRKRAERLFGFRYRIEIFVPAARRTYGYYVFPLLEGDRIVARAEIVAERAADRIVVKGLWPERAVRWTKGRQQKFEAELGRIAPLSGCKSVTFADGWLREAV